MAIVINGSGTVTGLAVGGLPDGTVDDGTVASGIASSKLTGALPAISGANLTGLPGIDVDADAWHYYMGTSQENVSAAVFDIGTAVSTGSNITESGGVITVGTAGWYLITYDAGNNGGNTRATDSHIRKNGTNIANSRIYWANAAEYAGKSRTIIIEASASDTFDVYGTGYWYGDSDTMVGWTGVRIGA
jgi:hypothetical protein